MLLQINNDFEAFKRTKPTIMYSYIYILVKNKKSFF